MEILFADKEENLGFLILDESETFSKISETFSKIEEKLKGAGIESIPYSIRDKIVRVVPISRLSKFPEIPHVLWDNPIIWAESGRTFHITSILPYRTETRQNYLTFDDF